MDPIALVAGGLMALLFGVAISNSDDDDSSSPDTTEEVTVDPEAGTVTGTGGDDMIDTTLLLPMEYHVDVDAGAGNDTVDAEWAGEITGGDGDDVLTVQYLQYSLDGGTGDDILNVGAINGRILGGEGNDTINYDDRYVSPDEFVSINAGAGDDVINAAMDPKNTHGGLRSNIATGAGHDEIAMTFDLTDIEVITDLAVGGLFGEDEQVGAISDFDPVNDILTIDPTAHLGDDATVDGEAATITYNGYEIVEDETGTTVVLNYDATTASGTTAMRLTVALNGATNVPADAIRVITG